MTREKMQRAWVGLGIVVVAAAAGSYPPLPELADGGGGSGEGGAPLVLELLAGDIGGRGTADGSPATARFFSPAGAAIDGAGNVYVADQNNSTLRKVTAAGVVTTLAGTARTSGSADGAGADARFNGPAGVAIDSAGNVYVADRYNSTLRKVTPAGVVTTLAGTAGVLGSADGAGAAARFNNPAGVAVDNAGNVYVADTFNHTLRKITPAGVVTTLAGTAGLLGNADGTGAAARFNKPAGVAVDNAGNVYVTDTFNCTLRKITAAGVVTTLAGTAGMIGSADGAGGVARFNDPGGVAVDSAGNVYVADSDNEILRKVTPAGVVTTLAGTAHVIGSADGVGTAARFAFPAGVGVDSAGDIYVADTGNHTLRKVTAAGIVTTLAGTANMLGSADGTGADARFAIPAGVAVDSAGNVYVGDRFNSTLRRVTPAGVVTTLAGSPGVIGSADGTGAAARFASPIGVAADRAGNIYVVDQDNSILRKVTPAGGVTTLAGTAGMAGSADGTGAAARFDHPAGAAVDSAGNVYVADQGNQTLRKVTPAGVTTTLAGTAGMIGIMDGTGTAARFNGPAGVAVDSTGNVYVADQYNSVIRKVTAAGVVTTLAGTASANGSTDGTGAAARFYHPAGVAVDSGGNVYVTDQDNQTLRKVTPTGTTTTIAGAVGVAGTILGPTPQLAFPDGLAIVGDSIVLSDANAILLLRHGAR